MGAEILLAAAFGGAVLFVSGRRLREADGRADRFALWAALLFLAALALRLYLGYTSEGFSTDMDTFKSWARITNEVGFSQIYRQSIFLDYPPGYLYVLDLLEKARLLLGIPSTSEAFTLVMKLPSILADLACAGVLLYAGKRRLGEKNGLFLAGAYLFCPAVFINSAQWGQADSFCTAILLASVLLLYRESYLPSAILYGAAIACKPQMLIFAPLYLCFAIKQRKWWKLLLGIAAAFGAILLVALPFTTGSNFLWLLRKYESTLHYYNYYSVNAYNLWSLLGWNWKGLPPDGWGAAVTLAAPAAATLLCGLLVFLSKRKDALFACVPVLMAVMYLGGVKMHERYLFQVFLFLLLAFAFVPDKRLLRAYGFVTAANYLNVAYVLYLFRETGGGYDPNTWITRSLSVLQTAALVYLLATVFSVYVRGTVREAPPAPQRPLADRRPVDPRFRRADCLAVLAVTLLYGILAFWNLGSRETALTPWTPAEGESAVLEADGECDVLTYLPGLAPDENHYVSRVGVNFQVETSPDGKTWTDCGTMTEGYVFTWKQYRLETPGRYVRLTALDGTATLNEASLKRAGKTELASVTVREEGASALTDEQGVVPLYTTYGNSSYFDEIYHARTAYEHILGLEPYENTHPPLGKYIISLGIRAFGMNPFGWRFMGTLFGVLMLPVLYHLLKQLFGKPWLCTAGTLLFAFDFMHFTQTRIATIDTYAVFFLLLMYDAMVVFLRRDLVRDGWRKLLPPLLLCGIFTGLGIASKWTAAYGAVGLAVLFFGKLGLTLWEERRRDAFRPLWRRCLYLCLWCCLFFLAVPFALYYAAFLPLTTLPHNAGDPWASFWNYQTTMFNYHSQLKAEHYFASPWYEWPFDVRPIWYFSGDPVNAQGQYSTISALGNPLLWWAGIPAVAAAGVLWVREKRRSCAVVLAGFLSAYLPWVLVPRLTFIYHYFTAVPFLVVALAALFYRLSESGPFTRRVRLGGRVELSLSSLFLGVFTAGCLLLFAVYFPVISGAPTSRSYTDALELFDTWYFG